MQRRKPSINIINIRIGAILQQVFDNLNLILLPDIVAVDACEQQRSIQKLVLHVEEKLLRLTEVLLVLNDGIDLDLL